jgi:hypothetical protein
MFIDSVLGGIRAEGEKESELILTEVHELYNPGIHLTRKGGWKDKSTARADRPQEIKRRNLIIWFRALLFRLRYVIRVRLLASHCGISGPARMSPLGVSISKVTWKGLREDNFEPLSLRLAFRRIALCFTGSSISSGLEIVTNLRACHVCFMIMGGPVSFDCLVGILEYSSCISVKIVKNKIDVERLSCKCFDM